MKIKLTPCPLCETIDNLHMNIVSGMYVIDCECGWVADYYKPTEEEAKEEWNEAVEYYT